MRASVESKRSVLEPRVFHHIVEKGLESGTFYFRKSNAEVPSSTVLASEGKVFGHNTLAFSIAAVVKCGAANCCERKEGRRSARRPFVTYIMFPADADRLVEWPFSGATA
jgi:hypothetical protein